MDIGNLFYSRYILLADDDQEDRDIFSEALAQIHSEAILTEAENGVKLMDILNVPPKPMPDVIFLDLNMPLKSGYECMEEIRRDHGYKNAPVVIFTTSGLIDDIDEMYRLGATHYVSKPGNFNALKEVIKKVISIKWEQELVQPHRKDFVLA